MSEQRPRQGFNVPVWGIFLLFIGIVLLLQTARVLPWELWGTLWRFWPVLIIAFGVGLLLRQVHPLISAFIVLVLFFGSLGLAIWQHGSAPPASAQPPVSYTQPLNSVQKAQLDIRFTAGRLVVGVLGAGSPNLVESDSSMEFSRLNNEGRLSLSRQGEGWPFWDKDRDSRRVDLSNNVPLSASVKTDLTTTDLNLSNLKLTGLNLDTALSTCTLRLPAPSGTLPVSIKSSLSTVTITIPQGTEAKITASADLSSVNIRQDRFTRQGDVYTSAGYATAANRIDLNINSDLSSVEVE